MIIGISVRYRIEGDMIEITAYIEVAAAISALEFNKLPIIPIPLMHSATCRLNNQSIFSPWATVNETSCFLFLYLLYYINEI